MPCMSRIAGDRARGALPEGRGQDYARVLRLPARYVIHTVGPWYESREVSAPRLARCYESSLRLANENGLRSIAFPAISCGVYGYPIEEAAEVAIEACRQFHGAVTDLRFVLYGQEAYEQWLAVAQRVIRG